MILTSSPECIPAPFGAPARGCASLMCTTQICWCLAALIKSFLVALLCRPSNCARVHGGAVSQQAIAEGVSAPARTSTLYLWRDLRCCVDTKQAYAHYLSIHPVTLIRTVFACTHGNKTFHLNEYFLSRSLYTIRTAELL